MVKLEDAVIARLSSRGSTFEVLVDPELALEIKAGGSANLRNAIAVDKVFKDSKKGDAASEELIRKTFGTLDVFKVAEEIIKWGEVQVTTEQRRKMREQKLRQIVSLISRRAVLPHPLVIQRVKLFPFQFLLPYFHPAPRTYGKPDF